jgi:hypothetical protein
MNKILFLAMCTLWFSLPSFAHVNKTSEADLKKLNESYFLQLKLNEGSITNRQFREQLLNCSDEGNVYCSSRLGDSYYRTREYSKAYPLLIKSQGIHVGYHDEVYADSDEILGYIFTYGHGALQNHDKAIGHFKVCASVGDKNCANNIARIYNDKLTAIGSKNVYSYKESSSLYEYLKQGYAWNKIAQSLGMHEFVKSDGKSVSMFSILQKTRESLGEQKTKEADQLASKICATIPKCIQ